MQPSIELVLTGIALAAQQTNLYTFERPDGGPLPAVEPGSHIGLHLPGGLERQYSLIRAEPEPRSYTIGVKHDPLSRGGSRWMHEKLRVGMRVPVDPPRNNFPLVQDAGRTVLIAGGIGITPIYSMTRRLRELGRPFTLHYACRSRRDAVFLRTLASEPDVRLHFDDEAGGRFLAIAAIVESAPAGTHLYCCGPAPMLAAFEAASFGRAAGEVHVEYFTARHEAATVGGYTVVLARSGRTLPIVDGVSILDTIVAAGIDVPHSCREGVCGACETRVLEGEPDHRDTILSNSERAAGRTMMICCSGARTPTLVLEL